MLINLSYFKLVFTFFHLLLPYKEHRENHLLQAMVEVRNEYIANIREHRS